jgi:hypothetical protein
MKKLKHPARRKRLAAALGYSISSSAADRSGDAA